VIVRILGEGQFNVAAHTVEAMNAVDTQLQSAVETGDEIGMRKALAELEALVREVGERMPDDYLGPSEIVLPDPDSTLEEVRALLSEEGLIPG
jgi:hypothetical protein